MDFKHRIKFLIDCINTDGDHFGYGEHFPCEVTLDLGFELDEEEEEEIIKDFKSYLKDAIGGGFDACRIQTEEEFEEMCHQYELSKEP